METTFYWKKLGGHVHVRVFMNRGKCGNLVFREEEWEYFTNYCLTAKVKLVEEEGE